MYSQFKKSTKTFFHREDDNKFSLRRQTTEPGPTSSKQRDRNDEWTEAGAKRGNHPAPDQHTEELANAITGVLNDTKIGLKKPWGQHNYLPDRLRKKFIDKKAIEKALPRATTDLVDYILSDASKTFAIVLVVLDGHEQRHEAMEAFHFHGFRDSKHLPVPNIDTNGCCEHSWEKADRGKCHTKCPTSPRQACARHDKVYDCFHHSCWSKTKIYKFLKEQPPFVLQHFDTRIFQHHEIGDDRVLPFLQREGMEPIEGGFGIVYPATMLADYLIDPQGLIDVGGKEDINIAIKVLKPDSKGRYDLADEWRRESTAHRELNGLDAHLIKAIAAFTYRGDFCLLLEWADGGSLQSLWTEELQPILTRKGVLELLDQLVGLASAMHAMHNKETLRSSAASFASSHSENLSRVRSLESYLSQEDDNRSLDAKKESGADQSVSLAEVPAIEVTQSENVDNSHEPEIEKPPNGQNGSEAQSKKNFENWRHGDIKPANILRFNRKDIEGKDLWLGMLKLADLGRAKQRKGVTEHQLNTEIDLWRSEAHEAPDIHIDPTASMSRLYDSWSMGTVIFNIVVWMLYGHQQLHNFMDTTALFQTQGSPYWTRSGRSAEVSAMATLWMTHILREDVECNRPAGTAMGDLMKLVMDELLVVGLPPLNSRDTLDAVPGQRSSAARFLHRLKEIRTRALDDEEYLFTGSDRSGMLPPPSGNAAVPEIQVISSAPAAVQKVAGRGGLLSPDDARGRALSTRQRETYTHDLNDKWLYEGDNQFARHVMQLESVTGAYLDAVEESSFCTACQLFVAISTGTFERMVPDLDKLCSLCQILQNCAKRIELGPDKPLVLARSGGSYIVAHWGRPVLRVCRAPYPSSPSQFDRAGIPVGLPLLSRAGGAAHVAILRAWLDDCDSSDTHKSCRSREPVFVPKRLLNIGKKGERRSKLIETASQLTDKSARYLALSYPWGENSSTNPHFKSNRDNVNERMTRIRDIDLPLTFRHAVQIARELGVKYIWIDSICILQKTDSDPGDFHEEAKSMESIFASAYCVIAVSSAKGMNSGFLSNERLEKDAVRLPRVDNRDEPATYLCEVIDDFQEDVLEGPLNKRGWVLQERALARRTIFFTNNQTYWECSHGIRCETLSKLTNKKVKFLGDSNFPSYASSTEGGGRGAQEFLFQQLYADYSRLGFSVKADRPFGISALEQRLTRIIGCASGAGMFLKFWGRCLLWKRDGPKTTALVRISNTTSATPGTTQSEARRPPTWSWMAYEGGISYLQPPEGRTTWNEKTIQLQLTGSAQISWLYASNPLKLSAPIKGFAENTNATGGDYNLIYDNPNEAKGKQKKCVIIGSVQDKDQAERGVHYVLIVSPAAAQGGSDTWERIGAGKLHGRFIPDVNTVSVPVEII